MIKRELDGTVSTCKLCGHAHTSKCKEDAPNAQFRCACPGECVHHKHLAYCSECVNMETIHRELDGAPQDRDRIGVGK